MEKPLQINAQAKYISPIRAAGSRRYAAIAAETGVASSLLRKLASGERSNPCIDTIQPLLEYFAAIDCGKRELPQPRCKSDGAQQV